MISDLWVFEIGDVMLLTLPLTSKETVLARLDQFIFTEDVQLGDVTDTFASVAVVGPDAGRAVSEVLTGGDVTTIGEGGNFRATFDGEQAIVLRVDDAGVPGYEVLVGAPQFDKAVRGTACRWRRRSCPPRRPRR